MIDAKRNSLIATARDRGRGTIVLLALCAVGLFLLAAALQYVAGAFSGEFEWDSASHYISGLLVHDYILSGHFANPIKYMSEYHSHYPLVGIGGWPPLYYFVEALWMLILSTSRVSVLLLSTTIAVTLALTAAWQGYRTGGWASGLFVGAAFTLSPLVQEANADLMLDVPVGLAIFLSLLAYVRFLERGQARYSAAFGVLAVIALLIKGNAGCLVLFPPLVVLIGRRFDLLRKAGFWLPVGIVAIGAGPWYALTYQRPVAGFQFLPGLHYSVVAFQFNSAALIDALGPVVFGIALIGLARNCARRRNADALGACASALALSVFVFLLLVPTALQSRYLIPAMAPLLLLAARECKLWCECIARRFSEVTIVWPGQPLAYAVLLLSLTPQAIKLPMTRHFGATEVAEQIWRARLPDNPSVLLATDPTTEGSIIAELALRDPHRPSLFVVRGSRLLGGGGYNNADYVPRFTNASAAMAELDRYAIPLVVLRNPKSSGEWAHIAQIDEARGREPTRWRLIYSDERLPIKILLFRIAGNEDKIADIAALTALSAPNALQNYAK